MRHDPQDERNHPLARVPDVNTMTFLHILKLAAMAGAIIAAFLAPIIAVFSV